VPICSLAATHALEDAEEGVQVGQGSVVVDGLNKRVYDEKASDSSMASASVAVLNGATAKRWRTMHGCKPG